MSQGGTAVDRNLREPYSQQASLQIDRQVGKGLAASVGYLWVAGHKLVRPIDLNVGPPIGQETGTNKDIYAFGLLVPSIPAPPGGEPGTNGIFYYTDSTGNSAYNGLMLQATEKLAEYLRLERELHLFEDVRRWNLHHIRKHAAIERAEKPGTGIVKPGRASSLYRRLCGGRAAALVGKKI
jgi:hypothetical protein